MAPNHFGTGELVDVFNSLSSDPNTAPGLPGSLEHKRALALGSLLAQLTDQEVINLRIRLNAMKTPDKLFVRLPSELQLQILAHLDFEDLFRIRRVCRSWNAALGTEDTCLELLKRHFPRKYEQEYRSLTSDGCADNLSSEKLKAKKELKLWFDKAALARIRRARGQYHSVRTFHQPHLGDWSRRGFYGHPQYNNGRIAYLRGCWRVLVVKSLDSPAEECFMDENRHNFALWLLSDKYIVTTTDESTDLLAWPLENLGAAYKRGPHVVRLPNRAKKLSARGDCVAIVSCSNEVFLWDLRLPGQPLRQVEVPIQFPETRIVDVVFNAYDENIFFVCTLRNAFASFMKHIQMREIQDGTQVSTYEIDLANADPNHDCISVQPLHDSVILLAQEHDSHLFSVEHTTLSNTERRIGSAAAQKCEHLTFDMESKEFERHASYAGSGSGANWRNCSFEPERENCIKVGAVSSKVTTVLLGDDRFVVLFGKKGYAVWCFEPDVKPSEV
ncbi:uncharacterized protein L3040_009529 [Drepanopeziza brunnea f. sp. 'multigermtubi']|nr:hypothetical protein L3040_009529 [Drepanopeziza brunnea f. sp. 'multigermtubi']